jgi:hypothetical protein
MKPKITGLLGLILLAGSMAAVAEDLTASQIEIRQAVLARYPLAQLTADNADLAAAGAVLVLQKDALVMNKAAFPDFVLSTYKGGAVVRNGVHNKLALAFLSSLSPQQGAEFADVNCRRFAAGEKFWLTNVQMGQGFIRLFFISDPYDGQRYHSGLDVPFPKGTTPTADLALNLIGEVIRVDDDASHIDAASAQAPASAGEQPATKTIALGQDKEQVVAVFGPPSKIVKLSDKEIDYFPDMKVTFVRNKVTDVK